MGQGLPLSFGYRGAFGGPAADFVGERWRVAWACKLVAYYRTLSMYGGECGSLLLRVRAESKQSKEKEDENENTR